MLIYIYYFFIRNSTTLVNGRIVLNENSKDDTKALEKYAFSNALALSGKKNSFVVYYLIFLFVMTKYVLNCLSD